MASTYTLISSTTLSSTTANITFSSIPSTYTDLVLRTSTRQDQSFTNAKLFGIYFNGDNSNLYYSATVLNGTGAAVSSTRTDNPGSATQYDSIYVRGSDLSTDTTNTFASAEIYIPSYRATQARVVGSFSATENNATTAYISALAGLYTGTTAVTSIGIQAVATFEIGSSFYLYGIKNS
jgi:hypothetical protein